MEKLDDIIATRTIDVLDTSGCPVKTVLISIGQAHTFDYAYDPAGRLTDVLEDEAPMSSRSDAAPAFTRSARAASVPSPASGRTMARTNDSRPRRTRSGGSATTPRAAAGRPG